MNVATGKGRIEPNVMYAAGSINVRFRANEVAKTNGLDATYIASEWHFALKVCIVLLDERN